MEILEWPSALSVIATAASFLKKPLETAFDKALKDGYESVLKNLKSRFKNKPDLLDALKGVDAKPESTARQNVFLEEALSDGVSVDADLEKQLEMLETLLKQAGQSPIMINVSTSGTGNNVNVAGRDINIFERKIERPIIKPNETHIAEQQAKCIQDKIAEISKIDENAGKKSSYGELYGKLRTKFQCTSYKSLPKESYNDAINWLDQEKGKRTRSLRRSNNSEWRKRKYRTIHGSAKTLGWNEVEIKEFAANVLGLESPPKSLKDLKERQLDKIAQKISSRSKKHR